MHYECSPSFIETPNNFLQPLGAVVTVFTMFIVMKDQSTTVRLIYFGRQLNCVETAVCGVNCKIHFMVS